MALVHDHDPVAHAHHFFQLAGNHNDGNPLLGQVVHELVDFILGAYIYAARRVVQDKDLGFGHEPLGNDHLLLIAARQRVAGNVQTGSFDVQALGKFQRGVQFGQVIYPEQRGKLVQIGQGYVFQDRLSENQSVRFPIFWDQAEALQHRTTRAVDL